MTMMSTMTRAETATVRLDEDRYATIDDLVQSLRDVETLVNLVWRMSATSSAWYWSRPVEAALSPRPGAVVALRYGSPIEVVLAVLPEVSVVFASVALAWERITAGARNLADSTLKRSEARKVFAETERIVREASDAVDAAPTLPNAEVVELRRQQMELKDMLRGMRARIDALETREQAGATPVEERRARIRAQLGDAFGADLAKRFDAVVGDEELDGLVETFKRLADKNTTIEVEGG